MDVGQDRNNTRTTLWLVDELWNWKQEVDIAVYKKIMQTVAYNYIYMEGFSSSSPHPSPQPLVIFMLLYDYYIFYIYLCRFLK